MPSLADILFIQKDYQLWKGGYDLVCKVVQSWPKFAQPLSPEMQGLADKKYGWQRFLKRRLMGKALDDVKTFQDIALSLGIVLQAEASLCLYQTLMTTGKKEEGCHHYTN